MQVDVDAVGSGMEGAQSIARFLNGCPRLVCEFRQQNAATLDTYTDTDWAGCTTTRKYTLGGCVMFGSHAIKHWSSMQASIAFGSWKAESQACSKVQAKDWDSNIS